METRVVETMVKWLRDPDTKKGEVMMAKFRDEISLKSNFSLVGPDGYSIIFTSSQSESNSTIMTSCVRSFIRLTSKRPHIILGKSEHESITLLASDMEDEGVDVTYVNGEDLKTIADSIKPSTCIISIAWCPSHDIRSIGELAKKNKIPFHSDVTSYVRHGPNRPHNEQHYGIHILISTVKWANWSVPPSHSKFPSRGIQNEGPHTGPGKLFFKGRCSVSTQYRCGV